MHTIYLIEPSINQPPIQNAVILGADALDNRSVHVTSYNHWDTLSDKDSVSLQVCLLS